MDGFNLPGVPLEVSPSLCEDPSPPTPVRSGVVIAADRFGEAPPVSRGVVGRDNTGWFGS